MCVLSRIRLLCDCKLLIYDNSEYTFAWVCVCVYLCGECVAVCVCVLEEEIIVLTASDRDNLARHCLPHFHMCVMYVMCVCVIVAAREKKNSKNIPTRLEKWLSCALYIYI